MDSHLAEAFRNESIQLFIGSGLSSSVYKRANELAQHLLDREVSHDGQQFVLKDKLDATALPSLRMAAEYYESYTSPLELVNIIKSIYGRRRSHLPIHEKLWQLPGVRLIYTTNYDCLIEWASQSPLQEPFVSTRLSELPDQDAMGRVVFKPHGCAVKSSMRQDFVITRSDYDRFSHFHVLERLKTLYDIFTRTFVFLGYSFDDDNIRRLMSEAKQMDPDIRAYAMLHRAPEPYIRCLEKLGVKVWKKSAEDFIDEALTLFPPDRSEWASKIEVRVSAKEKIANLGVDIIKRHRLAQPDRRLNILVDSGTTCRLLVEALLREIESERISRASSSLRGEPLPKTVLDPEKICIATNSAPVIGLVSEATRALEDGLRLVSLGGTLRASTRAFVFQKRYRPPIFPCSKDTLAFVGATALDHRDLMTKTKEEVLVKQWFVANGGSVYVLVDQSKDKRVHRRQARSFAKIKSLRKKVTFVTDNKANLSVPRGFVVIDSSKDFEDLD